MGFLDQNTTYLNTVEFPVVEGYCGSVGAACAIAEGQMEDFSLFEAALNCDFKEIAALKEGVDIVSLQEAGIQGIITRIVEFLQKLGAKIKALFTSFMAKLDSYMTKDSKKFVEKYEKSLLGKSLKGMKAKYAAPKGDGYVWQHNYSFNLLTSEATTEKVADGFKREEYIEEAYGKAVGGGPLTQKEFKKEVHDKIYKDEETVDNWDLGSIGVIASRLKNNTKALTDLKKANDKLQADIKRAISDIQKDKDKISKNYKPGDTTDLSGLKTKYANSGSDGKYSASGDTYNTPYNKNADSDRASAAQRKYGYLQEQASAEQTVIMTLCSTLFNEAKWGIAQDRRIFAQAVAYRAVRGDLKEDAAFAEAAGEVAQYECESEFENMEIYA